MSHIYDALQKRGGAPEPQAPEPKTRGADSGNGAQAVPSIVEAVEGVSQEIRVRLNDKAAPDRPSRAPGVEQISVLKLPPLLLNSSTEFALEMAGLYSNLLIAGKGDLRTVMLCGADPGAGTTTFATNLASYLAQQGRDNVLLIDANIHDPSIFRFQANGSRPGFHEFLSEQAPLTNYITPTSTPKLFAMNAGRITPASGKAFSPARIEYALSQCRAGFSAVVFDAPPVGSGVEALELAKWVESVVLVVRSNSPVDGVQRAKTALDHVHANVVGVIFNRH